MDEFFFKAMGWSLTIVMICIAIVSVALTYKFCIDFIL